MVALAKRGRLLTGDTLYVIRGTNGDSRYPDYWRARLFLLPFTLWIWRELVPLTVLRCADLIVYHNLRFSCPWYALSQRFKGLHRSTLVR